jgi:hypothetical protein
LVYTPISVTLLVYEKAHSAGYTFTAESLTMTASEITGNYIGMCIFLGFPIVALTRHFSERII